LGEVLDAGIAGYDAACALGDMIDPAECYARGFHPTGVCGPIGAAAGVGRLTGLTEQEFVNAFAIGASSASGLLEFLTDGSWTKRFHAGHAAASGLRAARLAQAGFTGPPTALEGQLGFLHAFGARAHQSGGADRAAAPGHGIVGTAVKLYPCCRYMHGCIDLLIDLTVEEEIEASDVAEIRCGVLSAGWDLVAAPAARKRSIETHVDAQFSMPFGAALAITHARASLDDFAHPRDFAGRSAELIAATQCFTSARLDSAYPARWGAEVEVRTRRGAKLLRYEQDFRGSPRRPPSRDVLLRKASELIDAQRAGELLQWCADAPTSSSIDEVSMLRSEPTHDLFAPSALTARAAAPSGGGRT
jgi:2-methylcitrate dehydratase PrpD